MLHVHPVHAQDRRKGCMVIKIPLQKLVKHVYRVFLGRIRSPRMRITKRFHSRDQQPYWIAKQKKVFA